MDVITISDDEVECVKQVINLAPIVVDLTDDDPYTSDASQPTHQQQEEQEQEQQQPQPPRPPTPPEPARSPPSQSRPPPRPQPSQSPPRSRPSPPRRPQSYHQAPPASHRPPPSSSPAQDRVELPIPPQQQLNSHNSAQLEKEALKQQQNLQNHQQDVPQKAPLTDHELMVAKKNLGNEKYKKNQFNDAIRTYREASELAKRLNDKDMSATIHFNLAMTYDRLGSYIQAADECAVAVKLKSDYMKPQLKRAEIYERLHKFDEAVICWEYICELDPSNKEYAIRLNRVREAAIRTRKKDPLELLGLNPRNFTRDDLRKAYKKKALSHHPDKHPDADIVTRRIQEKLFKDASEAHSYVQLRYGYNR